MKATRLVVLVALLMCSGSSAWATVPGTIDFQAVLYADTTPITTTSSVIFRIYNAGTGGDVLWSETQNVTPNNGGQVNLVLGLTTPIPDTAFVGPDCWLGVQIESDPELFPRTRLTSAPFAFRTGSIDGASGGVLTGTLTVAPGAGTKSAGTTGEILVVGNNSDTVRIAPGDSIILKATNANGIEVFVVQPDTNGSILKIRDPGGGYLDVDSRHVAAYNSGGQPTTEVGRDGMFLFDESSTDTNVIIIGDGQGSILKIREPGGGYVETNGSSMTAFTSGGVPSTEVSSSGVFLFDTLSTDTNVLIGPDGNVHVTAGGIKFQDNTVQLTQAGAANGLPEAGGTMTGAIFSVGDPPITMGPGNFGSGNTLSGTNAFVAGESNTASGANSSVSGGINSTASGTASVVSGGSYNMASGDYSFVGGGGGPTDIDSNSAIGSNSTIGGGKQNVAIGLSSFVGGGEENIAYTRCVVAGGRQNTANGIDANIGGGWANLTFGQRSVVGGGGNNHAYGNSATVAGGGGATTDSNSANANYTTIGGGRRNIASGIYSTISGGTGNQTLNIATAVCGGGGNTVNGDYSNISGGLDNTIDGNGNNSTIAGGYENYINGVAAIICGGGEDTITIGGSFAVIAGGRQNTASGGSTTIGGGFQNTVANGWSTVSGGTANAAIADGAMVPGGRENTAGGTYSFAAGRRAKADHDGAFVWGDNTASDVASTGTNQFIARASGGVTFYTNTALSTGVTVASGGGSWGSVSDRNVKENFKSIDASSLLEQLSSIPISEWNYISQDDEIRHIGPMAQDFYAAFGVGEDDKHITSIDAQGVALAAIQELNRRTERIGELEERVAELTRLVEELMAQR